MPPITIYVLCHNRPGDAKRCIQSVLAQTDPNYVLIVSDNSSNGEVGRMVQQNFPEIQYVRRQPMLPALEHFNRCIDEVPSKHFCLFHDDDLMAPDFVQQVRFAITAFPEAIAIGCNARIETNGQLEPKPSFLSRHAHEVIDSDRDLATRYFGRHQSGIAPFPGYVYRGDMVSTLRFSAEEGKYSDVTWLLRLAAIGQIIWIRKPLMVYRIHGGNDGLVESRRDRLRFLAYLKMHAHRLGTDLLADYRFGFIYKAMEKSTNSAHPNRLALARKFLNRYRWERYMRLETWHALAQRALVKKMNRP